jgi:type I restriction-modification system DNA methylase subunit
MDEKSAIKLLDDTFNNEFDLNRFSSFINELFNHFNISVRDVRFKNEYNDYIDKLQSFGVYRDKNNDMLEVFVVKLKKSSSRDRARTMQRNLIATYLKKYSRNGALVAFYDDSEDWRFSFVKIEYDLVQDNTGNLKVLEELTPAKRYSFLVGKNEPNHTCKRQFLDLIIEESKDPELYQIEETYSIENVTKDFFIEYKELYLRLKESLEKTIENDEVILQEFEDKVIKTSDFAKKLMGQIVFVYFLQKKGWLGVEAGKEWGTGPKKFLRKLFDGKFKEYKNFFNDVLEPFFHEALSKKWEDNYYPDFKCKIPFLNGGLFDPINGYKWNKTEILLDNDIFAKILDTFDNYNFTVKEDEPLEKEVAVDPEMLGKVFENLLDVEDRKSKGAFYTPREIVHYMCQESLINYLDTNSDLTREDLENFIRFGDFASASIIKEQEQIKKYGKSFERTILPESIKENYSQIDILLKKIKVVDPSVGSGAFPVGMMNEIIKARSVLSLYSDKKISNYELKLETIENSLYGVDIDSSAVDVTKLRFWLSLIVDENNVHKIDPLPNLDHKIMCGNSLLEEFEGKKLFDEKLLLEFPEDNSAKIDEIQKQIDELHRELGEILTGQTSDDNKKDQIQSEIKKLMRKKKELQKSSEDESSQFTLDQNFNNRVKTSRKKLKNLKKIIKLFFNEQNADLKKKYKNDIDRIEWELIEETMEEEGNEKAAQKIIDFKKNKSKPFFLWKLHFFEIFQNKNPGFDIVIANPPYIGEKGNSNIFQELKTSKKWETFCTRRMNIYYCFIKEGLDLLKENGSLTFIIPQEWLTADSASTIRKEILIKSKINKIIHFMDNFVFEKVGTSSIVLFLQKSLNNDDSRFSVRFYNGNSNNSHGIFENSSEKILISQSKLDKSGDIWQFTNNNFSDKLVSLKEIANVSQGIVTGADKVLPKHINNGLADSNQEGRGIFVLKESIDIKFQDNDIFINTSINRNPSWELLNDVEKSFIKPLYGGVHLKEWGPNKTDEWIIYIFNTSMKNKPVLYKHFRNYKKILINRSLVRGQRFVNEDEYDNFSIDHIKKIYSSAGSVQKVMRKKRWYEIFFARESVKFEKSKLVTSSRAEKFCFSESVFYGLSDVNFIFFDKKINPQYLEIIEQNSSLNEYLIYLNILLNSDYIMDFIKGSKLNAITGNKIKNLLKIYKINFEDDEDLKIYHELIEIGKKLIKLSEDPKSDNLRDNKLKKEINDLLKLIIFDN